jgi:hypothetical protein
VYDFDRPPCSPANDRCGEMSRSAPMTAAGRNQTVIPPRRISQSTQLLLDPRLLFPPLHGERLRNLATPRVLFGATHSSQKPPKMPEDAGLRCQFLPEVYDVVLNSMQYLSSEFGFCVPRQLFAFSNSSTRPIPRPAVHSRILIARENSNDGPQRLLELSTPTHRRAIYSRRIMTEGCLGGSMP